MSTAAPAGERTWPPADSLKRGHLLSLLHGRGHSVFVESGTYLAGTVEYFIPFADRIVSIEIDPELHRQAVERLGSFTNVELLLGDATELIPRAVADVDSAPLVWLDGHFSGGITGRGEEIEPALTILRLLGDLPVPAGTTIAVDDLRLFGADPDWPTLDELVNGTREAFPHAQIYAAFDALVICQP